MAVPERRNAWEAAVIGTLGLWTPLFLTQSFVPSLIHSCKRATHWGPEVNEALPDLKQLSEPQRRSRHVEGKTYGTGPR